MTNVEIPNKNILENDFIKLYKPLIYIQTILGSVKVNIRNKFLSPPLWIQTGYSLVYITVNLVSIYLSHSPADRDNELMFLFFLQFVVGLVLNVSIILLNNTFNRNSMVELFVTLQTIDRELKVIGKERHNRKIYLFMIQSIIVPILIHSLHMLQIFPYLDLSKIWFILLNSTISSVEDFEMILFMMIMIVLHQRVCYINKLIHFSSKMRWQLAHFETQMYKSIWQAFVSIVRALRLVVKIFRIFILLLVTHLFIYQLINVKKALAQPEMKMMKIGLVSLILRPLLPDVLSVKYVLRICVISILIRRLESSLLQTRETCIHALKVNIAPSRCYIKNIMRLISTELEPLTVFNLFPINIVALQSISLNTKYSFVLFQFAIDKMKCKN